MDSPTRCDWVTSDPIYVAYHDQQWGVPELDDRRLFAKLMLDGFQAGLSWLTILKKRAAFYAAFAEFEPAVLARWGEPEIQCLLGNRGIVRNRAKIEATLNNARCFLRMFEAGESFSDLLWDIVDGQPQQHHYRSWREIPAATDGSRAMARALRERGFRFCGPTICYAFMQAVGMVNDHIVSCFRRAPVEQLGQRLGAREVTTATGRGPHAG